MRRRAFTLIELLVVIAIVALLLAVLLPALAAGREGGRGVACLSNLRQFMIAAAAYATDERDTLPIAYDDDDPDGLDVNWDFTLDPGPNTITPGLLWRGEPNGRVQQCPSYEGPSSTPADPFTGYNYNTSYLAGFRDASAPLVPSARIDDAARPGDTATFGDGRFFSGANKFMRAPLRLLLPPNPVHDPAFTNASRTAGTQDFRHRDSTHVAWLDGHASAMHEAFAPGPPVVSGTGFLSIDNALYDLQ